MDFWDLTKLLVRRWFVAVPLLLLTAVGAVGLALTIKPDYIADSYITLVPPRTSSATSASTARNPWLDSGLLALGSAAIYSTQDVSVLEPMVKAGYSDNFTMAFDGNSPIIKIEVTAASKDQAKATAQELARLLTQSVATLQAQAPLDQLITVQRLDHGDNIKASTTKLKRAVIAVIGAGMLLSIALTAMVDAILQRRARRRASIAARVPEQRTGRHGSDTNGAEPPLAAARTDIRPETVVPSVPEQANGRAGTVREPRAPGTGEYRSLAREQREAQALAREQREAQAREQREAQTKAQTQAQVQDQADQTTVFPAASGDAPPVAPPMPSDATMILPLPEKDQWALRDGSGNNRGGSSRR